MAARWKRACKHLGACTDNRVHPPALHAEITRTLQCSTHLNQSIIRACDDVAPSTVIGKAVHSIAVAPYGQVMLHRVSSLPRRAHCGGVLRRAQSAPLAQHQ